MIKFGFLGLKCKLDHVQFCILGMKSELG